jgi:hypothetical protein
MERTSLICFGAPRPMWTRSSRVPRRRPADRAANKVRAGNQPEGREGTGPQDSAVGAGARGRGDSVTRRQPTARRRSAGGERPLVERTTDGKGSGVGLSIPDRVAPNRTFATGVAAGVPESAQKDVAATTTSPRPGTGTAGAACNRRERPAEARCGRSWPSLFACAIRCCCRAAGRSASQ